MSFKTTLLVVCTFVIGGLSAAVSATGDSNDERCLDSAHPVYSNVQFDVVDITSPTPVTVKGVLTQPVRWVRTGRFRGCYMLVENPPAVVILHGSAGMDTRNAFYAQSLQGRYATLSIEMFQGSVSGGATGRPPLPLFNYSYAFGAFNYLVETEGFIADNGSVVSEVVAGESLTRKVAADPKAVGCLGLSWGGVICNQVATKLYSRQFGDELYDGTNYRFAAHVANYPVCYARNIRNPENPNESLPGSLFASKFGAELTGAKVLIQVGSEDAYDNAVGDSGSESCIFLKERLFPDERKLVEVVVFDGGYHAFDRLFAVSGIVRDPFARLGSGIGLPPESWPEVAIIPDQVIAKESLRNVFRFFRRNLSQ